MKKVLWTVFLPFLCTCLCRCPALQWKQTPFFLSSKRNWPFSQVHACVFIWCRLSIISYMIPLTTSLSLCRGQRSSQWSDFVHPSQLRSDQYGGTECYTGLPAQYPQVYLLKGNKLFCFFLGLYHP